MVTLTQVLLVTGGFTTGYIHLSSTEVLSYPDGQAWRKVGPLPSPRAGLRGASLDGVIHVTGGQDGNNFHHFFLTKNPKGNIVFDSVLAWDPVAETWSEAGKMDQGREVHAITPLPLAVIEEYCS